MGKSVKTQVIEIIAGQALLETSEVSEDASVEELGLDSLGLVESIFAIEEAFDISVPFNANEPSQSEFDITTVKSIIAAVEKLIAEKGALKTP